MNANSAKVTGTGSVESLSELDKIANDNAPDPMEPDGIAEAVDQIGPTAEASVRSTAEEPMDNFIPIGKIDETKVRLDPSPSVSHKRTFSPQETQDARIENDKEGGIYVPATGDSMKNFRGAEYEGGILRPTGSRENDEESGDYYEMSGFVVQFKFAFLRTLIELAESPLFVKGFLCFAKRKVNVRSVCIECSMLQRPSEGAIRS